MGRFGINGNMKRRGVRALLCALVLSSTLVGFSSLAAAQPAGAAPSIPVITSHEGAGSATSNNACTARFTWKQGSGGIAPAAFKVWFAPLAKNSSGQLLPVADAIVQDRVDARGVLQFTTAKLSPSTQYRFSLQACANGACTGVSPWVSRDFSTPGALASQGCQVPPAPPIVEPIPDLSQQCAVTVAGMAGGGAITRAVKVSLFETHLDGNGQAVSVPESTQTFILSPVFSKAITAPARGGRYRIEVVACGDAQCSDVALQSSVVVRAFQQLAKSCGESAVKRDTTPLAPGEMCNPGAARYAALGSQWCEGVFRLRGVPLDYLLPQNPALSSLFANLGLNYDSGFSRGDHLGMGPGWLLGDVSLIYAPSSDASELSFFNGDGSARRLLRASPGVFRFFGAVENDTVTFANNLFVHRSADGTVERTYRALKPQWYVLGKIEIRQPGLPVQSAIVEVGTKTSPGGITFSDGSKIAWKYTAADRSWKFSGVDSTATATIFLDTAGQFRSAKAVKGAAAVDYSFSYNVAGKLQSYSSTEAGKSTTERVLYNPMGAVAALVSSEGFVTRFMRLREKDDATLLKVISPDRRVDEYRYSADRLLVEQRYYDTTDGKND